MQYKESFKTDRNVSKVHISGSVLCFVPSEKRGFVEFCGDNEKLQKWCEELPATGMIESDKIPYHRCRRVANLACDFLHGDAYGTWARGTTHIMPEYAKGEVVDYIPEHCLIMDTGGVPPSVFDGLEDPDEIYKHSIAMGYVDHHTIDMLPAMEGQPKKCATQMAVDYHNEIAQYYAENSVHDILIHKDTDLDAICAAWIVRERYARDQLPPIAQEMAEIVNKVDYAEYRLPTSEYVKSFAGCMGALLGAYNRDLGDIGQVNPELLKVLDVISAEKDKNPQFDLRTADMRAFINNSPDIGAETKQRMNAGLQRMEKAQERFEEDLKNAEIVEFNFMNPQTHQVETGKMVIMSSANPLAATNLGYARFGKNTVMAVYAGERRTRPDSEIYDIGIASESAATMTEVMKDICVAINKAEEAKRRQSERIIDGLESLPIQTAKEKERIQQMKELIQKRAGFGTREAFVGAKERHVTNEDPSPLVGRNCLLPASHTSVMSEKNFVKTLKNWANSTKITGMSKQRDNSEQR